MNSELFPTRSVAVLDSKQQYREELVLLSASASGDRTDSAPACTLDLRRFHGLSRALLARLVGDGETPNLTRLCASGLVKSDALVLLGPSKLKLGELPGVSGLGRAIIAATLAKGEKVNLPRLYSSGLLTIQPHLH
jgi:hypothetical protein